MKNSPSITQRVLVEQESGSEVLVSTHSWLALAKKSGKNDVPLSVLEQVYCRGYLEAKPHPKNTPEQQAFLRVESFLHQGKAYEMDDDLVEIAVPDGRKHIGIIKNVIKKYEAVNKQDPQEVNEWSPDPAAVALGRGLVGFFGGRRKKINKVKKEKSVEDEAKELAAKQDRKEQVKSLAAKFRSKPTQSAPSPTPAKEAPKPQASAQPSQSTASRVSRLSKKMTDVQRQKNTVKSVLARYRSKQHAHTVHVNRQAGARKASELLSKDFHKNPTKFRQQEKAEKAQSMNPIDRKKKWRAERDAFNSSQGR